DHKWTTQPMRTNHKIPASTDCTAATRSRPWTSWPSPGIKKLQTAAMTLPVEPWPDIWEMPVGVGVRKRTPGGRLATTLTYGAADRQKRNAVRVVRRAISWRSDQLSERLTGEVEPVLRNTL